MNALTSRLNRTFLTGLITAGTRALGSRVLPLAICVTAAVSASATTVIDSFNDISGGSDGLSLVTLNTTGIGGVGFTSKYEQTGSGVIVLRTNDLVSALTNYVSGQSSNQHWSVAATIATAGSARRTQTRSFPPMFGTIWFTFVGDLLTTNGDVALTFNGGFNNGASGSPASSNKTPGMRVGLGSYAAAAFRQALGVGPATAAATSLELSNIVNGVNGAVTTAGFVPVGTPVVVLGRIDSDPTNGQPRVSIWYNPDVPDVNSLPAPTLTFTDTTGTNVPTTITRIGYQVNRSSAPATQNEAIDNVKVSDEPNGFDIVYKNAPLPVPSISLVGTVLTGSEAGPTNIVFNIVSSAPLASATTINYVLSGVATNGYDGNGGFVDADYTDPNFNQSIGMGSVTIPEGGTNATVVLQVIDDTIPEGDESVVITLQTSSSYILASPSTLTGVIIDNNDANVSLQYMFTHTLAAQVFDTNMIAYPANVAGLGANYSGTYFISGDVSYNAEGTFTGSNATQAVANGDYMGITIAPVPGQALTLTNFDFEAVYGNYQFLVPSAANATVFVRSSLDGFTTNLAEFDMQPDNIVFPNEWYSNYVALGSEFSNIPGQVEFRLYIYDDSDNSQVGVRIDNLYFNGTTTSLPPGLNQVEFTTNIVNASEPATPGQVTLVRQGDTTTALTVNYSVNGTASNGVDYVTLPGTVTFAAGQSNAVITVMPIDDDIPEQTETVILTLLPAGTNYGVLSPGSATVNLLDDGDVGIGALVAYFFNEDNNAAASLSAVAVPTIKQTNAVTALNATVGSGCGPFGRNAAGIGNGYADTQSYSPPSTFYVRGQFWGLNETDALTNNFYLSLTVAPTAAHSLTLTNFSVQMLMSGDVGQEGFAFLRSSVDNFAADLGAFAVPDTEATPPPFLLWNVPLSMPNLTSAVEFRVYMYGLAGSSAVVLRLDDATFYGSATNAVTPSQPRITGISVTNSVVQIGFTDNSGASVFNLQSSGAAGSGYANVNSATLVTNAAGQFTFSTTTSGTAQFYRISR